MLLENQLHSVVCRADPRGGGRSEKRIRRAVADSTDRLSAALPVHSSAVSIRSRWTVSTVEQRTGHGEGSWGPPLLSDRAKRS